MVPSRTRRRLAALGIIVILATGCGDQDQVVGVTDPADPADPGAPGDVVIEEQPKDEEHPRDNVIEEHPGTGAPEADLLDEAQAWLEAQALPDEGIPPGFIAIDRLLGECVRSFGIEVLEPETAYRSGVYYFRSGDQPERVTEINAACNNALSIRGVLLEADAQAFTIMYESYVAMHNCLLENGFPTSQPPTLETFVDSPHIWTPWMEMIGDSSPMLLASPPADGSLATYHESTLICPRP